MSETEKHKKLKLLGRVLLKDKGFLDTEIYEEYKILIGRKNYVVDICGINPRLESGQKRSSSEGKAVAVECGTTNSEKLINLKLFFDEVICLPYGILSLDTDLRKTIEEYMIKVKSLENEIKELEKVIRYKEGDIYRLREREKQHDKVMLVVEVLKRQADENRLYWGGYSARYKNEKIDALMHILEREEILDLTGTAVTPPLSESADHDLDET